MTIARIALTVAALVLAGIGAGFLAMPVQWASIVDISLPTAMARTDLRATYGGFDLGMGLFLALCALRTGWVRQGLAALGLGAGGYGGGRLLGILVEGTASPLMVGFLVIETVTAVAALELLRRLSKVSS